MSEWAKKLTERLQPEFAELWVAIDPDDLLLTPAVSHILAERGFTFLPLRDPLVFRLEYENALLRDDQQRGPILVHLSSSNEDALPWDIKSQARIETFSVGGLFPSLDPNTVRMIGPERFNDLFSASKDLDPRLSLGESATRDFIATHVYGIVPSLMRRPSSFWSACFSLFFRNDALPGPIATHVAGRAVLPSSMSTSEAASLLSSRAAFNDRVQADWLEYAAAVASGKEPQSTLVPFSAPEVRINLDSMVLDGAVKPAAVEAIPAGIPMWMHIGFIEDEGARGRLLERQVELLIEDIPTSEASHKEWLGFAIRQSEAIASFTSLDYHERKRLADPMLGMRRRADDAFFPWLAREFGSLSSISAGKAPVLVHQIASHVAHRRSGGAALQALIVIDGLALDQWSIIEAHTKTRHPDLLTDTQACFAWLPTLTSVSRQAIFAGDLPRTFPKSLTSTSGEASAWKRFWSQEGLPDYDVAYGKSLGISGTVEAFISGHVESRVSVIGLVINTIDEMLHGAVMGKAAVATDIREWLQNGEWDLLISTLTRAGYEIHVTADHGNVEAHGIGRPAEGVAAEQKGERVRVYDSEVLRDKLVGVMPGTRSLKLGGLPRDYHPVFAPFDGAFLPVGSSAVVHGGTSIEEVIVPFVRIARKEIA